MKCKFACSTCEVNRLKQYEKDLARNTGLTADKKRFKEGWTTGKSTVEFLYSKVKERKNPLNVELKVLVRVYSQ